MEAYLPGSPLTAQADSGHLVPAPCWINRGGTGRCDDKAASHPFQLGVEHLPCPGVLGAPQQGSRGVPARVGIPGPLRLPAHSQGTYVPGPEHISLNNPQRPTWPGRTRARPQPWHRVLCHRHPAGSTALRTAPLARPCTRPWEGCQAAIRPASVIS